MPESNNEYFEDFEVLPKGSKSPKLTSKAKKESDLIISRVVSSGTPPKSKPSWDPAKASKSDERKMAEHRRASVLLKVTGKMPKEQALDLVKSLMKTTFKEPIDPKHPPIDPYERRAKLMLASGIRMRDRIIRARQNPVDFAEFVLRTPKGGKVKLTQFHKEWMHLFQTARRTQIEASKSHAKTTIVIAYIIWAIGTNKDIRIKLFTQSEIKAKERLAVVSQMIEKNKLVKLVFPDLEPDLKATWKKSAIQVVRNISDKEPTLIASGIMGSVEGGRADLVIFDDISDFRNSIVFPQIRETIKRKVFAEIMPMLEADGRAISIATPHHECLHPLTKVRTSVGLKSAKDITSTDLLMVSPGVYEKPIALSKSISHEIYSINIYGHPEPIMLTGNHRVPTSNGLKYVEDLNLTDKLLLEGYSGERKMTSDMLPLLRIAKVAKAAKPHIKSKLSKEQLAFDLLTGMTYGEIAKKHGLNGKSYVLYLIKCYGLPRRESAQRISSDCVYQPEFWRLIGYWLAEGYLNTSGWNHAIHLCFGKYSDAAERAYIDDAYSIVTTTLKIPCHIDVDSNKSETIVSFRCKELVDWLSNNFGRGEKNKRLPPFFQKLPIIYIKQALLGWILGDGNIADSTLRGFSSSLALLSDWQLVLAGMGIATRVNISNKAGTMISPRNGKKYNKAVGYVLQIHPEDAKILDLPINPMWMERRKYTRKLQIRGSTILFPIKEICKRKEYTEVYDVETSTGYFNLSSIKVHNSDIIATLRKNKEWTCRVYAVGTDADPFVPLWPERWSRKALMMLREEIGPIEYDRAYRCKAISHAMQIVKPEHIRYYTAEMIRDPWQLRCIHAYDLAITDKKGSSYSACVIILYDPDKDIAFVADAWHTKVGFSELAQLVILEANKWQPDRIAVEETGFQAALRIYLTEVSTSVLPVYPVKPGSKSKELRLMETLPMLESGKVYFNPKLNPLTNLEVGTQGDLITQLLNFTVSQDKDLGDAFAYGIRALRDYRDSRDEEEGIWDDGDGMATRISVI